MATTMIKPLDQPIKPQPGPQEAFLQSNYTVALQEKDRNDIISLSKVVLKELVMNGKAKIYGLFDPEDKVETIVYVGRTVQPLYVRINQHIDMSRRHRSDCARAVWIRSLLSRGVRPGIKELEEVDLDDARETEGRWIAHFRSRGMHLLNEQSHNVGAIQVHSMNWTPEKIALLGKYSDTELAEKFGVDRKTVEYKRKSLNIPRKPQSNFVTPPTGGWNKVDIPQHVIARLGTISDIQLGKEIGVSKKVIANARRERGIAAWTEKNGNPTRFSPRQLHPRWDVAGKRLQLTPEQISRLGTVSDQQLAEELGYKSNTPIYNVRRALGIPSAHPKTKKKGGDA